MAAARITGIALLAVLMLSVGIAAAQPSADDAERAVARKLGYEGVALYQKGEYAKAFEALDRAYQILAVPTLGLWSARALDKLGRLVEASERYRRIERHALPDTATDVHKTAKEEAAAEHKALLPRLASVRIDVRGVPLDSVVVTLDNKELSSAVFGVAVPADPGNHELVATRGDDQQRRALTLAEGEAQHVVFDLEPLPEPSAPVVVPLPEPATGQPATGHVVQPRDPDLRASRSPPPDAPTDPWPIVGWVAIGLGGAAVVAGFTTGGLAASKKSDLDEMCVETVCDVALQDDVDSYNTLRHVSTGTFVAGGVLLAAGVLTLVLAPDPDDEAPTGVTITPFVGPTAVGIRGAF